MKRSNDDTARLLVDEGFALYESGRAGQAEEVFRAAVVCDPANEDAWIGLGCSLDEQERHAEAAMVFGLAAATASSSGAWPTLLAAEALLACGEEAKARGALAWFEELERAGMVAEQQRTMAAQIRTRLGRST